MAIGGARAVWRFDHVGCWASKRCPGQVGSGRRSARCPSAASHRSSRRGCRGPSRWRILKWLRWERVKKGDQLRDQVVKHSTGLCGGSRLLGQLIRVWHVLQGHAKPPIFVL